MLTPSSFFFFTFSSAGRRNHSPVLSSYAHLFPETYEFKIYGLTVLREWWITVFFPTIQILGKVRSCLEDTPTSFHATSGQLLSSSSPSSNPWQRQKQQAAPDNVLLLRLVRCNQTPGVFGLCVSTGTKTTKISKTKYKLIQICLANKCNPGIL